MATVQSSLLIVSQKMPKGETQVVTNSILLKKNKPKIHIKEGRIIHFFNLIYFILEVKPENNMSELIQNLSKPSAYPAHGHYTVADSFEGIYTATYQPPGCFYSNPIYNR